MEPEQERKYFGMTVQQLAILAGLAVGACLLFGVAGMLFLRGGTEMFEGTPENIPNSQSTSTPFTLPTVAASQTPTPIPYETLVPAGWTQFKTALVEIWLPAHFKPADPKTFTDLGDMETHELVLTAPVSETSLNNVLVFVSYKPLTADSLDMEIDRDLAKRPASVQLAERTKIPINSTEAVRIVLEMRDGSSEMKQMTYVFQDGGTIWLVSYLAQINDFFELLDEFEKGVKTFRVVR